MTGRSWPAGPRPRSGGDKARRAERSGARVVVGPHSLLAKRRQHHLHRLGPEREADAAKAEHSATSGTSADLPLARLSFMESSAPRFDLCSLAENGLRRLHIHLSRPVTIQAAHAMQRWNSLRASAL